MHVSQIGENRKAYRFGREPEGKTHFENLYVNVQSIK